MKREELYNECKAWLEAEKLSFEADLEDYDFRLRMNLDNGIIPLRIVCEESPATLQLVCAFPLKVTREKSLETGRLLHQLNAKLRIGAFNFIAQERLVTYRLVLPVHREIDLPEQFGRALGTVLNTMDEHLPLLACCVSSTKQIRKDLAELLSDDALPDNASDKIKARFELN
jgi:hypothetical protein